MSDSMACLKKSYKKDGIFLRVSELSREDQKKLVDQLFHTPVCDREYTTKKFLARIVVKRQREAGMIPDPNLLLIAGE